MKIHALFFPASFAFLLTGCMTYEKKWEKAVAAYESGGVKSPEGPWIGTWETRTNGHTGNLRAIVSPSETKAGEYDFHYHATWAKIFSGAYRVSFPVEKQGGRSLANGEKKLGPFGTFGHRATITRDQFKATYSSEGGDLGDFEMERPR